MNPFMISFAFMGLIYFGLALWAAVVWLPSSLAISIFGLVLCAAGWKVSETYLQ